jgi:hypothetical protein
MSNAGEHAPRATIQIISGCADYCGPSALVRVHGKLHGLKSTGEYVFGVGESLSRGLLEHKVRPSGDLRATFSSTLSTNHIGGIGGLILRLRSDGHKQVCCRLPLFV